MDNDSNILRSLLSLLEKRVRAICAEMLSSNREAIKEELMSTRMTRDEVSEMLGKDVKSVSRYEANGLKCYHIGRTPLYFKEDVEAFIEQSKNRVKNPKSTDKI